MSPLASPLSFTSSFCHTSLAVAAGDAVLRVNFVTLRLRMRMMPNVRALDHKIATQQEKKKKGISVALCTSFDVAA